MFNKVVDERMLGGDIVQKSPNAFEKQKQIAAQRKQQRSTAKTPAKASAGSQTKTTSTVKTTTSKTTKTAAAAATQSVTAGIAGATGPSTTPERGYTITGLNSSDTARREQLKQEAERDLAQAEKQNTMKAKLHLTPEEEARLQEEEAQRDLAAYEQENGGNTGSIFGLEMTPAASATLTEEDRTYLKDLWEAMRHTVEQAVSGLSSGQRNKKKQEQESANQEDSVPGWFETKYPELAAQLKAVGKNVVELASQAPSYIGQRIRTAWESPAYTEKDLIPYTSVEESEYWEAMEQGRQAEETYNGRISAHLTQQELYEKAWDLAQRYANEEDFELTPEDEEILTQASHYNVWIAEPESFAAWGERLAQEGAALKGLEEIIQAGEEAERQARAAGYYFEPTEREKSEERLAEYRGDPKEWELSMPDADAPKKDWLAWEKEVMEQKTAMEAERDDLIRLYEYAKQYGDEETMERIKAQVSEMNREIKHMGFSLNVMNEDFAENSQVNEDYSRDVIYYMVNRKNLPYEKNPIRGFEDQVIAPPGGFEKFGEMSDEQVAFYNYLFDGDMKNGTRNAGEYLAMIEPGLLYQQAVKQEQALAEFAEESPGLAAFLAPLYSAGKAKIPLTAAAAALTGYELSPYDPVFNEMRAQQTMQETVAAQLPEWAQIPYSVANGIVEDAVSTLVGGKIGGAIIQAISSGIDSYYDVLERGGSGGQAAWSSAGDLAGSAISAGIPWVTSKIPVLKRISQNSKLIGEVVNNSLGAVVSAATNVFEDNLVMKDNSLWNRSVDEIGGIEQATKEFWNQVFVDTIVGIVADEVDSRKTTRHVDAKIGGIPDSKQSRLRIMDLNDPAFSKYSRSIEKYQKLLESRDNMLLQLHRAQMSGDQAKIKEYTKGLNTLNKEILYQENHSPMLKEALKVQEIQFNQQNK